MIEQQTESPDRKAFLIDTDYFDAHDLAVKEALFLLHVAAQIISEEASEGRLRDTVEDTFMPACSRLEDSWRALQDRDNEIRDRWREQRMGKALSKGGAQ